MASRRPAKKRKARECWVLWHKASERPAMYLGANCDVSRAKTVALLNGYMIDNPLGRRSYLTIRHFVEVRR